MKNIPLKLMPGFEIYCIYRRLRFYENKYSKRVPKRLKLEDEMVTDWVNMGLFGLDIMLCAQENNIDLKEYYSSGRNYYQFQKKILNLKKQFPNYFQTLKWKTKNKKRKRKGFICQ